MRKPVEGRLSAEEQFKEILVGLMLDAEAIEVILDEFGVLALEYADEQKNIYRR